MERVIRKYMAERLPEHDPCLKDLHRVRVLYEIMRLKRVYNHPRTGTWRMNREKIQELKDDGIRAVPSEMFELIGKTPIRDI